jgi:hypothetical protein
MANDNLVKPFNSDLDNAIYAALAITSQSDPMSNCQQYTDVYPLNSSLRTISVNIKRLNNVDNQTSVLTYTINSSTPLGDGSGSVRTSTLKIGCQFDGPKTYTYTITRADYR